jgi:hypothetical protein
MAPNNWNNYQSSNADSSSSQHHRPGLKSFFSSNNINSSSLKRELRSHKDKIDHLEERLGHLENAYTRDIEMLKYIEEQRLAVEVAKRRQFLAARDEIRRQAWVDPKLRRYVDIMGIDNVTKMMAATH